LLVARYDRQAGDDECLVRIHQEDFCQALGVVSEMKYQNEGGLDPSHHGLKKYSMKGILANMTWDVE
jgi:hypothetical protein